MKYQYGFVTGEVNEIEVDEKWLAILSEMDEEWKSCQRRETRRHESANDEGEWAADEREEPFHVITKREENLPRERALDNLTEEQEDLVQKVFNEGKTMTDYAMEHNVTEQAISGRVQTIRKKLKKVF